MSPVSSASSPPNFSGSSLPHRQIRTIGSSVQQWHGPGKGFITEDFRVGGPLLCAVPVSTMPLRLANVELSRLINETPSPVREAITILTRYGVQDPDVDILTRQSRLFPKSAPIVAMLVIAQRDTIDDKWLRAAYEIPDLFLRKNYQNMRVEIAD